MLFVYVHGETNRFNHCLTEIGIHRAELIANKHAKRGVYKLYTVTPHNISLVACAQTGANVCSILSERDPVPIELVDNAQQLPECNKEDHVVVIWYGQGLSDLLQRYNIRENFAWPYDNRTGCLTIYPNGKWAFDPKSMYYSL